MNMFLRTTSNRPLRVALVSLVLLLLFVGTILVNHRWDPMVFVMEGTMFSEANPAGTRGYDGQFVYYIARDPLNAVTYLDLPAHRYQRIVYPLLTWLLSLGGKLVLVPWVMVLINLGSAAVAVGLLAKFLEDRGANPWYALTLLTYIGLLFTVRADLNEPLALALALGGWVAYEKSRLRLAILLFALAGLAKEVGLIFPLALALVEAIRQNWRRAIILAVGSIAPYLILFTLLRLMYGSPTVATTLILIPFAGLRYQTDPVSLAVIGLWVLFPAIVAGLWATVDYWRKGVLEQRHLIFLVVAHLALIATMPRFTWVDPLATLRVGLGSLVTIMIWLAAYHPRLLPFAAALWAPSGLLLLLMPGIL